MDAFWDRINRSVHTYMSVVVCKCRFWKFALAQAAFDPALVQWMDVVRPCEQVFAVDGFFDMVSAFFKCQHFIGADKVRLGSEKQFPNIVEQAAWNIAAMRCVNQRPDHFYFSKIVFISVLDKYVHLVWRQAQAVD